MLSAELNYWLHYYQVLNIIISNGVMVTGDIFYSLLFDIEVDVEMDQRVSYYSRIYSENRQE